MKHKKHLAILLTAILLSVTACTTGVEDTSNADPELNVDSDINGITWLWERFDDTAEINNIVVDDPTLYTFLLNADGTYTVKADCNLANGNYTLEGNSIKFEAGPTTLAECGPDSLYNNFLIDLSNVVTFVIDENKLYLNLWADAGNMVFVPAVK
jgi:heat shock protein HslJ